MVLENLENLDLCVTIGQLNNNNRYVFYPFNALNTKAQLLELRNTIQFAPNDIILNLA